MVYVVFAFHGADGVKLAVLFGLSNVTVPATALPAGSVTPPVSPVTGSLNATTRFVLTGTLVAPAAGVSIVTVGRGAVVKVHVLGAITAPPVAAFAPDTVTV